MALGDIDQVSELERESFPSPWPAGAYRRELLDNALARYFVAVEPGREGEGAPELVVGVLGLWLMVDEAHIVTLAVRRAHRRRGVGESLLVRALKEAKENGCRVVTLECRLSNAPALALYEKYGFLRVGLRKRYYTDNNEDAVLMTTGELERPAAGARVRHHQAARAGRWASPVLE